MTLEHAEQSILSTYRRSHLCALSTFPTRENVKTRGVEDRLRPGSSRRNNLDLSNGRRTHTHTHTRTRARRSGASRRATRCEPDEPRTNGATNQWCDGPSLLSLTQRVYHTETDGRISPPPRPALCPARGGPPIHLSIPSRSIGRIMPACAKMIWRFSLVAPLLIERDDDSGDSPDDVKRSSERALSER